MKNRIDKLIAETGYLLDCLTAYRNIVESGCCNNCKIRLICKYIPKAGELVRYNCPFYIAEGSEETI